MTRLRPAALALVLGLAGCTSAPVRVDATAGTHTATTRPTPNLRGCGLALATVVDHRPGELGTVSGRAVSIEGVEERIRLRLAGHGIDVGNGNEASRLDVELMSAYAYSKSTSMTFTTVLRASLADAAWIARGTRTTVNWASGSDEIGRGVLDSVDAAVTSLASQLADLCSAPAG
jgi:hypothetical protein